ncbi:MAG TPA: glycerol-3-phosphate dehydrogenase/oxidase [bacterium]|nr:glycerol-3-phosphate dehydrogenase/oxidase [bacterium]
MKRDEMLGRIQRDPDDWDFIVIGGGATGLGVAIEGASRGYKTVLLEQSDFAKGTSGRSTKLVHGGVRYLQQGNVSLVLEALKERGLLHQNAPHLVHNQRFVVPNYDWWEGPFYGVGLKLYDVLAGKRGFGSSEWLSKEETLKRIPTVETEGLRGGIIYHDGQFDDSRLAMNMAQTAADQGGTVLNYMQVVDLLKSGGMVSGVVARDMETGDEHELSAKVVINATGPFTDNICEMDDAGAPRMIKPSQGVHIVLDRSFLPGDSAIMVPHTADGRVLFAIPWHNRTVVGTTDTSIDSVSLEPRPQADELEFLIAHAAKYLTKDPTEQDVLSTFAGIRPLVSPEGEDDTASISRDHTIHISRSGLVTIAGGKWTTYRKMAEDTIDQAATLAALPDEPSVTSALHIHGYHNHAEQFGALEVYGADAMQIQDMINAHPEYTELIHPELSIKTAEVIWAVREEMARTVEDFLSRRTRTLLLDARKSMEAAPKVADLMAEELGRDADWRDQQVEEYTILAEGYTVGSGQ